MQTANIENPARIRALVESVSYAMSSDSTRAGINVVHIETDPNNGDTLAIATDGHRVAVERAIGLRLPLDPKRGFSIPAEHIPALRKTFARPKALNGRVADVAVTSRGMEIVMPGRPSASIPDQGIDFPTWRYVTEGARPHHFALEDPAGFAEACDVLARIAKGTALEVKCSGPTVVIEVDYTDSGVTVHATAEFAADGDCDATFHINAGYLADAIRHARGTVSVWFGDNNKKPVTVMREHEATAYVMGMRK